MSYSRSITTTSNTTHDIAAEGDVCGVSGVLTILAWCIFSRPSVETYDRLEQRPANAYLGNHYLSVTGDFDEDGFWQGMALPA